MDIFHRTTRVRLGLCNLIIQACKVLCYAGVDKPSIRMYGVACRSGKHAIGFLLFAHRESDSQMRMFDSARGESLISLAGHAITQTQPWNWRSTLPLSSLPTEWHEDYADTSASARHDRV
jgi:hypothetical protein